MEKPYILFLGDSVTYGKFVPQPFPAMVEQALRRDCVNFGCRNAGIDSFLHDPDVLSIANGAQLTVLQVAGAQNLSNRFYRVHPRRNDRFLQASPILQAIYREVDFTEFSFNKHMLSTLQSVSSDRFETVRSELRQAWLGRMQLLLSTIHSPVLLLWLRSDASGGVLGDEPLMVDNAMIEALRDQLVDVVPIEMRDIGNPEDTEGMFINQMELPAALHMPGPLSHAQIADQLVQAIGRL